MQSSIAKLEQPDEMYGFASLEGTQTLQAVITLEMRDGLMFKIWHELDFIIEAISLKDIAYAIYPSYREIHNKLDLLPGFHTMFVVQASSALCDKLGMSELEIEEKLVELVEEIQEDAVKLADQFERAIGEQLTVILQHWEQTIALGDTIMPINLRSLH